MARTTGCRVIASMLLAAGLVGHASGRQAPGCALGPLPDDATVALIGVHRGAREPSDASKRSGLPVTDVTVSKSDTPVVLVLASHESIEWQISVEDAARLTGVFVSGLGTAVVSGLPPATPVVVHTRDARDFACVARGVAPFAVYEATSEAVAAASAVEQVVGRPPDQWRLGARLAHPVVRGASRRTTGPGCKFDLPSDVVVEAVGTYEGGELPTRMVHGGEQGNRVDVVVTRKDKPIALVLSGFDPVEWRVGHLPGVRLAGVFATGGGAPIVTGIPNAVLVVVHGDDALDPSCIRRALLPFKVYDQKGQADERIRHDIDALFGHAPERWQIGYRTSKVFVGPETSESIEYSTERGPVFQEDPDLIYPEHDGIRQLLARGVLLEGTREDFDRWKAGAVAKHGHPPSMRFMSYPIYRVVKPTALPAGLAGANAVTFIVDAGVPPPDEAPGHSMVLITDGFRCLGCW